MAIVSVNEVWMGRQGEIAEKGERTYSRAFRVITSGTTIEAAEVLLATGIPRRYDVYASQNGDIDTTAYCHRVSARQEDDPVVWMVEAQYSTKVEQEDKADEHPLQRAAEIEWGSNKFTRPLERANDGSPVRNSAGDAFDPPPEIEDVRLTLKIARNQVDFSPDVIVIYEGAVNDDLWFGFLPGEVRCTGIGAKSAHEKGISFWQVTYSFEMRINFLSRDNTAWAFKILDQGFTEVVSGERKRILDKFGAPVQNAAMLDGAGAKLAIGGTPVFRTFYAYANQTFANLQLP